MSAGRPRKADGPRTGTAPAFSPQQTPAGATGGCTWAGPPAATHPPRSHHAPAPRCCPRYPTSPSRSPARERGCGIPSAPLVKGYPANRQIGICNPPHSPCASQWSIARSPGGPAKGGGMIFLSCSAILFSSFLLQLLHELHDPLPVLCGFHEGGEMVGLSLFLASRWLFPQVGAEIVNQIGKVLPVEGPDRLTLE